MEVARRLRYTSADRMLQTLRASRADNTYDKKMLRFTTPDLLIIDDLGLRPLAGDKPIDLYEVIRGRYERGAMIVTSNRALEEWYPLFHDDLMASAAMDRPLHHAHVLTMDGDSYPPGPSTSMYDSSESIWPRRRRNCSRYR